MKKIYNIVALRQFIKKDMKKRNQRLQVALWYPQTNVYGWNGKAVYSPESLRREWLRELYKGCIRYEAEVL